MDRQYRPSPRRKRRVNPDQPRMFLLPDEPIASPPAIAPSNYTPRTAFRRIKAKGEKAQAVRDRLFVDLPESAEGYEAQADRAVKALADYRDEWRLVRAVGFGGLVVQQIEDERRGIGNLRYFPVKM